MYQKSPFPYLLVLAVIIGLSCITNLTIDKEIEQPIIHVIDQTSYSKELNNTEIDLKDNGTQVAYHQ
jgi:hypothetical protein